MKEIKLMLLLFVVQMFVFTGCTKQTGDSVDEDKLSKIESMLEIQNVISAYAMAWDREDTKEFVNFFHKDAIIIDSWHKQEIRRFAGVQEFMDARGDEGGNVGGHTLSLIHFKELKAKTASTEVIFNYFWYGNYITSTPTVNIRGSYIDEWIKTEKGWRIMKRIIVHDNVPSHRAEQFGMVE